METGLDVLSRAASYVETASGYPREKRKESMPASKNTLRPTSFTSLQGINSSNNISSNSSSSSSSGDGDSLSAKPAVMTKDALTLEYNRQSTMDIGSSTRGMGAVMNNFSPLKKRPRARSRAGLTDDDDTNSCCDRLASDDSSAAPPLKTMRILTCPPSHAKPALESQDLPLNLTTSTLSTTVAYTSATSGMDTTTTYTQLRPSVIIRAAHALLEDNSTPYPQSPSARSPGSPALSSGRREVMTAVDDASSIDEHFRRSLGRDYAEYPGTTASCISPTDLPPSVDDDHDSVDGSVDDHFARSLGQTKWNEIKSKSAQVQPSSVDDHFAKALGEQWASIKAQQENAESGLIAPS